MKLDIKTIVKFALLVFVIGSIYILAGGMLDKDQDSASSAVPAAEQNNTVETQTNDNTQTADPGNAQNSSCTQNGSCALNEVAAHNSPDDCWVTYQNKVYVVTSYVDKHHGGSAAFDSSTCGQDIEAQLSGKAGSDSAPRQKNHPTEAYDLLQSFYFADLVD